MPCPPQLLPRYAHADQQQVRSAAVDRVNDDFILGRVEIPMMRADQLQTGVALAQPLRGARHHLGCRAKQVQPQTDSCHCCQDITEQIEVRYRRLERYPEPARCPDDPHAVGQYQIGRLQHALIRYVTPRDIEAVAVGVGHQAMPIAATSPPHDPSRRLLPPHPINRHTEEVDDAT